MRLTTMLATAAVLTMVATPVFAAPGNPAAKLSLVDAGRGAGGAGDAAAKNPHKGGTSWMLFAGIGVAAVVIGAVALGHNDSKPASN